MIEISKSIGYTFENEELLKTAFTHTSYAYEQKSKVQSNERLEFLGDAVLELVISEYLFQKYPKIPEGEMTKVRAGVVCEKTLVKVAQKHNFSNFLVIGRCEKKSSISKAMIADLVEAVIGAMYLDGGFEVAKKFILDNLLEYVSEEVKGIGLKDYKTTLQELLQQQSECKIEYVVEKEEGPEHDKTFYVILYHNNKIVGRGNGRTKKEAEQQAAKKALECIENE